MNANTTPLLSTALALLKPGGWLQWEEMEADLIIEPAAPGLSKVACETLDRILSMGGKANGMTFDFLAELDQHLLEHNFQDVRMFTIANRKQDYKGWTEDFLMVWEEVADYFPSKATEPRAPITREFWAEMFSKAVDETEKGVALHKGGFITVVGRKPL